jgi:YcaO-like protein with predicted kinase domain
MSTRGDASGGERAIDLGGTIRAADVATTLARARDVARLVGISRTANVTGLDHVGVPTWVAVRPLAKSLTVSQGKGLTDDLARASAMMESIEVHHAEHFTPRGRRARLRQAARDERYVNPLLLAVRPNATIQEGTSVEWVEGEDIASHCSRWVPRDCINLDSILGSSDPRIFVGSSNGLASGNTRSEALIHALCEVIERDQESFWYARKQFAAGLSNTRLHLDSVSDEDCRSLIDKCHRAGLRVAVWYASDEIPIPCFICTVFDDHHHTFYPQRAAGAGCHPYKRIALSRAITEALQSHLTHIAGARDDIYWSHYRDTVRVDNEAGAAWVRTLDSEPEAAQFDDVSQAPPVAGIAELLGWVLTSLQAVGFPQVVVVELTRRDIGIPVVHVTVSGLEGAILKPGYPPGPRMQSFLRRNLSL